MDAKTLSRVMGNVPGVDYAAYLEPFNKAMTQAGDNVSRCISSHKWGTNPGFAVA